MKGKTLTGRIHYQAVQQLITLLAVHGLTRTMITGNGADLNQKKGLLSTTISRIQLTPILAQKKGQQMTDNAERSISLWDNYDNAELGASKSIFDPCPYGWRVASGDLWIGFARNGVSPYIDFDRNAYDTNTTEWIGDMSNINHDPTRSCGLGMTMYLG